MKRSFAALGPQEALHVAIFIEARNAELYHNFAKMFVEFGDSESVEIANVFWEMAVEERHHGSLLQSKYVERYGVSTCDLTEEDLLEFIEVPRLDDGDIFPAYANELPARYRALQVALQAELNAQRYYANLMANTEAGPLRLIYSELAQVEDAHVGYLEAKLEQNISQDIGQEPNEAKRLQ
jgi:rubrerythrin